MTKGQDLSEFLHGRVLFPVSSYLFNRRGILRSYGEMIKSEFIPLEDMRRMQLARLRSVIEYAWSHIPFYQKRFREIGLLPQDIKRLEDIEHIPPLSRQDVILFHKDMVDCRMRASVDAADRSGRDPGAPIAFAPFRRYRLVRNTSSGSTGAPTVFYENGSRTALNWAHELRLKKWHGIDPGSREVRMVRISTDYMPKSRVIRWRSKLWNQLIVPGVNLSDEDYAICLASIKKFKPRVIWGFTSAVAGFADYLKRTGEDVSFFRPELAVGWAAPVYEHEENLIREVLQCPVSNIYGAREVGHIAGRCPHGSFHVNQENLYVESQPTEATVESGLGEIMVTNLDITPMPFIRYRMGDVGEIRESVCACGRTLQVVAQLLGRTGEIFITKDNRMISPNFWCRLFMSSKISGAVKRFQAIYTKEKNLRLIIERAKGYSQETEAYLRETIRKNFSEDTAFEIIPVPKIEPEISGKYQMIVNEAR